MYVLVLINTRARVRVLVSERIQELKGAPRSTWGNQVRQEDVLRTLVDPTTHNTPTYAAARGLSRDAQLRYVATLLSNADLGRATEA